MAAYSNDLTGKTAQIDKKWSVTEETPNGRYSGTFLQNDAKVGVTGEAAGNATLDDYRDFTVRASESNSQIEFLSAWQPVSIGAHDGYLARVRFGDDFGVLELFVSNGHAWRIVVDDRTGDGKIVTSPKVNDLLNAFVRTI